MPQPSVLSPSESKVENPLENLPTKEQTKNESTKLDDPQATTKVSLDEVIQKKATTTKTKEQEAGKSETSGKRKLPIDDSGQTEKSLKLQRINSDKLLHSNNQEPQAQKGGNENNSKTTAEVLSHSSSAAKKRNSNDELHEEKASRSPKRLRTDPNPTEKPSPGSIKATHTEGRQKEIDRRKEDPPTKFNDNRKIDASVDKRSDERPRSLQDVAPFHDRDRSQRNSRLEEHKESRASHRSSDHNLRVGSNSQSGFSPRNRSERSQRQWQS